MATCDASFEVLPVLLFTEKFINFNFLVIWEMVMSRGHLLLKIFIWGHTNMTYFSTEQMGEYPARTFSTDTPNCVWSIETSIIHNLLIFLWIGFRSKFHSSLNLFSFHQNRHIINYQFFEKVWKEIWFVITYCATNHFAPLARFQFIHVRCR